MKSSDYWQILTFWMYRFTEVLCQVIKTVIHMIQDLSLYNERAQLKKTTEIFFTDSLIFSRLFSLITRLQRPLH